MQYQEYIESRQFQADCFDFVREGKSYYREEIDDIIYYSEEIDDIIDAMEGFTIDDYQNFINRNYEGGLSEFAKVYLEFHNKITIRG